MYGSFKRISGAGAATQAIVLASLLLVASAVFLSQTDKIFAKAASSNIRGTMVLADRGSFSQASSTVVWTTAVLAPVALPGTSCSIIVTGCMITFSIQPGSISPDILFDDVTKATGAINAFVATGTTASNNLANNGVANAQNICKKTDIISIPGGLHTVKIQTPTLPRPDDNSNFGITHAALAYDCTP